MARGVFPDSQPQNLGMPGMHGTVAAVGALQRSDLLIALGTRFDDRVTGQLSSFAPLAKVIHADIDPAEISKNRVADIPIVGDCKEVISQLISLLRRERPLMIVEWVGYLQDLKRRTQPATTSGGWESVATVCDQADR
jgi:acetolactate synthase-1/2/3 large subunit